MTLRLFGSAAGQQHDDAHDSAGVGHGCLSLALSLEFEVRPHKANVCLSSGKSSSIRANVLEEYPAGVGHRCLSLAPP